MKRNISKGVMFNRFSHLCVVLIGVSDKAFITMRFEAWSIINVVTDVVTTDAVIDPLFDVMFGVSVGTLVDVVTTAAIALKFAATALYAVDVMGDVRAGVTMGDVTDIGIDVLAGVMTALNFVLPPLLEEVIPFC